MSSVKLLSSRGTLWCSSGVDRAEQYEAANQFRHRHLSQHYYRAMQCAFASFDEEHRLALDVVHNEMAVLKVRSARGPFNPHFHLFAG